jgi:hypothetical protein
VICTGMGLGLSSCCSRGAPCLCGPTQSRGTDARANRTKFLALWLKLRTGVMSRLSRQRANCSACVYGCYPHGAKACIDLGMVPRCADGCAIWGAWRRKQIVTSVRRCSLRLRFYLILECGVLLSCRRKRLGHTHVSSVTRKRSPSLNQRLCPIL